MNLRKLIFPYQDAFFHKLLASNLNGCESVLDAGCGANSPLKYIKKTFYSEGVDIFRKSVAASRRARIHDSYRVGDIRNIDRWYKQKSFDAVICLDVIEHLSELDALALMKKMESIARKKVIILTPNGYYHQNPYDGNPHQVHASGWSLPKLKKLGYSVRGLRGLKFIRGECATIRYKPWVFWGFLSFISEPLCYCIPDLSYDLFAIKCLNN